MGWIPFQRSLSPSGTITSLKSGLPSRETCTQAPDSPFASLAVSVIVTRRRLAAPQMPRTALALDASVGREPSRVRCLMGTWIAIVCTFSVLSVSTLFEAAIGIRCRFWNGRSAPRSNVEPRST